jgi:hypothetical protein
MGGRLLQSKPAMRVVPEKLVNRKKIVHRIAGIVIAPLLGIASPDLQDQLLKGVIKILVRIEMRVAQRFDGVGARIVTCGTGSN